MSAQNPKPFSEEAAKRILARAAELDASFTGRLTETQLRDVAREAGIGDAAIDAAIGESRELDRPQGPAAEGPKRRGMLQWLAPVVLGLGVGVITGGMASRLMFIEGPFIVGRLLGPLTMCVASAIAAINIRTRDEAPEFQWTNFRLWAGFLIGSSLVSPVEAIGATLFGGALTAIAGALALRLRFRSSRDKGTDAPAAQY